MTRPRRWLLVLALVAASPAFVGAGRGARAGDVADEAQFHFRRGAESYRQGRFEDALAAFYASYRLVPNRNVLFNIARCLEQLKLYDEAFRAWSELMSLPDLPPAERATADAALRHLRASVALVSVESDPPGAEIYVDRRDLGSLGGTPKMLALTPHRARVILERPGYRPAEVEVDIVKGEQRRVTVALERIWGTIDLGGLPPGAVVHRDGETGEVLRDGPGTLRLLPGRHVLFVTAPGRLPARAEVDVKPDQTFAVEIPMAPAPAPSGVLVVRVKPEGALVRVDNREMGFAPVVIDGVAVGRRSVEIGAEGREPYRVVVDVKGGERSFIDVRLRRASPEVAAATKTLMSAEDAPASITVVTADEIEAMGYATLSEALAAVRGAFRSYDRTYESVGIRGFSPPGDYNSRVLVLVDGHPTNDVLTGQGYVGHDLDVDLAQVERIEVVRGPGSVLYGTGALFGVINVVTRRPGAGAGGEVEARGGTLGAGAGRVTVSDAGPEHEVWVSAAALDQAGERVYPDTMAKDADGERAYHADLAARLGRLSLRAGFNDRRKTVPTGAFDTRPEPGTTYRDVRGWAELRWDASLGRGRLATRAAYDETRFDGHYVNQPDAGGPVPDTSDSTRSRWLTGEVRIEAAPVAGHRFTVGVEGQDHLRLALGAFAPDSLVPGAVRQVLDKNVTEYVASAYAVDDWVLGPRARLNVGLRADDYLSTWGATLNPRLAFIAQPYAGGHTKILAGRAFRAPSAYERYYDDGGLTQIAATSLSPEVIVSGEVEHTHALSDDVSAVVAISAARISNLIVLCSDPSTGLLAYQNAGDTIRTWGGEGEIRWQPGGGLFVSLAYARRGGPGFSACDDRQPLVNAPSDLGMFRVMVPLFGGGLRLGSEVGVDVGRHTRDGEVVADAFLWNLTLSGRRGHGPGALRYFAGLSNILDDRSGYPVGDESPQPTVSRYGRSARVGASVAF